MLKKAAWLQSSLMNSAGKRRPQRKGTGDLPLEGKNRGGYASPELGNSAMQRAYTGSSKEDINVLPKMASTLECCHARASQFPESCEQHPFLSPLLSTCTFGGSNWKKREFGFGKINGQDPLLTISSRPYLYRGEMLRIKQETEVLMYIGVELIPKKKTSKTQKWHKWKDAAQIIIKGDGNGRKR